MNVLSGSFQAQGKRVGLVVSRFNNFLTERLLEGAIDGLSRHGIVETNITTLWVPGAFELPLGLKKLGQKRELDGLIALGAVIRGATPHFDYVAAETTKGISHVSLDLEIPIAMGVLTTDTIEQAIERSGTKAGNKGFEAALTIIEMMNVLDQI